MLNYLKKFQRNIEIVNSINCANPTVPQQWRDVLAHELAANRCQHAVAVWRACCSDELQRTINYLSANLVDVHLAVCEGTYSLIYAILNQRKNIVYYQGLMPMTSSDTRLRQLGLDSAVEGLTNFYVGCHNGFYHFASHAMGLLPTSSMMAMNEYEWGILEQLDDVPPLDLSVSYAVFSNGAGGYVVVDTSSQMTTIWFAASPPHVDVDFWPVVDEWMRMGMTM